MASKNRRPRFSNWSWQRWQGSLSAEYTYRKVGEGRRAARIFKITNFMHINESRVHLDFMMESREIVLIMIGLAVLLVPNLFCRSTT